MCFTIHYITDYYYGFMNELKTTKTTDFQVSSLMLLQDDSLSINTIKAYNLSLKKFKNYLNEKKIDTFNQDTITEYSKILKKEYKPNSYNAKLYSLKKAIEYNCNDEFQKIIITALFQNIKKAKTNNIVSKDSIITIDEYKKLNSKLPKDYALLLEILCETGMRISEAIHIKKNDIKEYKDCFIASITGKGSKERQVFIGKEVMSRICIVWNTKSEYLFTNKKGKAYCRFYVYQKFNTTAMKLGIYNFSPHRCRHFTATSHLLNGTPINEVSSLLGHASVGTTAKFYSHIKVGFNTIKKANILEKEY